MNKIFHGASSARPFGFSAKSALTVFIIFGMKLFSFLIIALHYHIVLKSQLKDLSYDKNEPANSEKI